MKINNLLSGSKNRNPKMKISKGIESKSKATSLPLKPCKRARKDDDNELDKQQWQSAKTNAKVRKISTLIAQFYCSICTEKKPMTQYFSVKSCFHSFCFSCIGQYVSSRLDSNVTAITCPTPACKNGVIELQMCRGIIPNVVFDRWGDALCEVAVGSNKFYCPFKDCSALLVDDNLEQGNRQVVTNAECPHCHRMFCAKCKVPWHADIDCQAFQKLPEYERGNDDRHFTKIAAEKKWQRCPSCKFIVSRRSGCNFMMCRCGKHFCYRCGLVYCKCHEIP